MKIQWLGHACFLITLENNQKIISDPYDPYVGFDTGKINCDLVTISHQHKDHNYLKNINNNAVIFQNEGNYRFNDINIIAKKFYHDEEKGKLRGENLIFKIFADNLTLCHLGDIGEKLNSDILNFTKDCDILFIPVGGKYTINFSEAFNYINEIKPKIIIPMHYKTKKLDMDIQEIANFINICSELSITNFKNDIFEINKAEASKNNKHVYVLNKD